MSRIPTPSLPSSSGPSSGTAPRRRSASRSSLSAKQAKTTATSATATTNALPTTPQTITTSTTATTTPSPMRRRGSRLSTGGNKPTPSSLQHGRSKSLARLDALVSGFEDSNASANANDSAQQSKEQRRRSTGTAPRNVSGKVSKYGDLLRGQQVLNVLVLSEISDIQDQLKDMLGFERFNVVDERDYAPANGVENAAESSGSMRKDIVSALRRSESKSDGLSPSKTRPVSAANTPVKARRLSGMHRLAPSPSEPALNTAGRGRPDSAHRRNGSMRRRPSTGGGRGRRGSRSGSLRRSPSASDSKKNSGSNNPAPPASPAKLRASDVLADTSVASTNPNRYAPRPTPQVMWKKAESDVTDSKDSGIVQLAFCIPKRGSRLALKKAVARAHVILADPPVLLPNIYDASRSLGWVHSTFAGVEGLVHAIQKAKEELEKKRAEIEEKKRQHEREKEAMVQKQADLQAKFDEQSPYLKEATQRVAKITKSELANIRSMKRPPDAIKLCLRAILALLGRGDVEKWNDVLRQVTSYNFKTEILEFDAFEVTEDLQSHIEGKYLRDLEFTYENMDRAYEACGSLARWLVAQLKLAEATDILRPLMEEIQKIKLEMAELKYEIDNFVLKVEHIDEEMKFVLSRSAGFFGPHVSEYCMGQIIARERNFVMLNQKQQEKEWADENYQYRTLNSLTVGILGVGSIGSEVARIAKAFGMHVKGMVHSQRDIEHVDEVFVCQSKFDGGLSNTIKDCDYIINTLPSTEETRDLLGGDILSQCRAGTVLINVGRGDIISEAALLEALEKKHLAGAVLDVMATEPLDANSPLWEHPSVTITPHVSARSSAPEVIRLFVENLKKYSKKIDPDYLVDVARGY
jgi:phosphoglycerate dehydrogenase-like enzyme